MCHETEWVGKPNCRVPIAQGTMYTSSKLLSKLLTWVWKSSFLHFLRPFHLPLSSVSWKALHWYTDTSQETPRPATKASLLLRHERRVLPEKLSFQEGSIVVIPFPPPSGWKVDLHTYTTAVSDVPRGAFHTVSDLPLVWCFGDTETDNFVCTSLVSS